MSTNMCSFFTRAEWLSPSCPLEAALSEYGQVDAGEIRDVPNTKSETSNLRRYDDTKCLAPRLEKRACPIFLTPTDPLMVDADARLHASAREMSQLTLKRQQPDGAT